MFQFHAHIRRNLHYDDAGSTMQCLENVVSQQMGSKHIIYTVVVETSKNVLKLQSFVHLLEFPYILIKELLARLDSQKERCVSRKCSH
jgi:hypothetical protein